MNACEGSGAIAPLRRWCGERGWTATKLMLTDCRLTDMLTETWERVRLMTAVVPTAHCTHVPTFRHVYDSRSARLTVPLRYRRNRAGGENLQPHHRAFRGRQREKYKSETHALSVTPQRAVGYRTPYWGFVVGRYLGFRRVESTFFTCLYAFPVTSALPPAPGHLNAQLPGLVN